MTDQPDVNDLFPAKSTDELFPPEVARENYRRQQLGTSPVQDLIFGNTDVNPVARVLDHFGQGFKQSWGDTQENLSKETEEELKVNKQYDEWNKGRSSLVKAANDALFRPAAVQWVKEVHDAEAIGRAASGLFTGGQAAVAQIGAEFGAPSLGKEIAAIPEAFMGTPHPTGMPAAPKYARAIPDLPKAASLKVIGAGEDGYFGTAPSVEAAKPAEAAPVVPKPQGMPVDLFAEPRDTSVGTAAPVEAPAAVTPAPEPGIPAEAAEPAPTRPIAEDVVQKLVTAGRPAAEAQASGELIASHYEARAQRFGGELGTAEELYKAEGPTIKGDGVSAPETLRPPPEADATVEPDPAPKLGGPGAAEKPDLKLVAAPEGGVYTPEQFKPGEQYFKAVDAAGNVSAELLIKIDGNTARIEDILNPGAPREAGIGSIGNAQLRGLLNQFREQHPEVTRVTGKRVSGARAGGEYSLLGKHTEVAVELAKQPLELSQIKRGKITLRGDMQPIITLFKDANASTFVHETGHAWLEELMKDADHPLAPADLRDDADTVREWLGVHSAEDIKTSHHEKFARGFERYMMEGKAPNQALAGVFAKFKNWLTQIYQTVNRLKSPINDEIRGVFDRLLTMNPSEVKIEPEGPAKTFADIHEADAKQTPPEMAHPAAETIQAERDSVAARHLPEDNHARLKGTPDEARRGEAGNLQSEGDANAAGPVAGEAGNAEASGAVGQGGIEAAPSSPRAPARQAPPVEAFDKFPEKAGNIRLDNLNTPEDLNAIIRQTAEENGDFQNVRGPVSDAQVLDLAEAAGVDAAFIDSRKLGEAWTAPQIVALRRLLIQSAQSVHELALKAAGGAEADVMAYAQAKARHMLIQERVSSVTAEAGRALRAFQSKFTEGVAGDVNAFLKEATGKTLFQLQQEAKFLSKLQTAGQTSRFVNDTNKGTFRNAILEYYINALISGPVTHSRYMVSNAVNALWTPLVEIPFAAARGIVREIKRGEPIERVRLGEAGAQLYGMVKGSRDGLSAAIEAFKTGVSPALPKEQVSAHFAEASHAIPGTVGQIIRLPSRSVAGIHSFFKALRYEQNVQALAYRTAATEGLTGDAFSNRLAELTTNPTEAMMTDATNNALKELYMSPTEYHSKMGGLVRFTNQNLAAKIVVPFMKIGSQITRNAFMERTPLGVLDKKVRENLSSNSPHADLQAGRIAGGVALMATSVGLCAEGMMTGDGPEDPAARAVWLLSHTPASIQIGDVSFKYGNTGPLGMLMRFAANTYETAHAMGDKDMGTLAVSFFQGFSKSVLDETFLRGVKDALDAMFHPKEYGAQYLKSQVTNWMPWSVGSSQIARKIDPFQRETHGIFQAAQAKIPWLSERLMPRRDMFGEPIPNGGPLPDYANDPVIKAMDSLHLGVGKIGKKIRGVDLTEEQYDDLARIAGRMAKTRLNAMVGIISNPNIAPGQRIEMIHTAISSSRETARSLVMMQNPAIVKQATDAKLAKLRGTEPR